jgi:hypothetical protein
MKYPVTAQLIQQQGRVLRQLEISEKRAAELSTEVGRLNAAAVSAGEQLDFNDEPSRFLVVLAQMKE